jgi:long-chain fatty acid transport protein
MKLPSTHLRAISIIAMIVMPLNAIATNGYFLIGYGAKSRSMGGVGVAYGQDGLAAAANPAAMNDVEMDTMRFDVGGEVFNPPRSVIHQSDTLNNPNTDVTDEKSGSNLFLIPSMGGIYKFNRKLTIGMAVVGNGANTRYDQTVPGLPDCVNGQTADGVGSYFFNFNCNADSQTVGANLLQMQILPSVAYRVTKNQSIGASLAIAVQQFRAYGLGAFSDLGFAGPGAKYTSGNGNDYSYGAGIRLGWLGKFFDQRVSLGVNYSSRIHMTKFDKYSELFAEHGSFDIPENYAIGAAFKVTPKITLAADVEWIKYGSVASISNPGPSDPVDLNPLCPGVDPPKCQLGGSEGMGFGWEDVTVYKVGVNYDYNDQWSFRTGYNYGKSPIQPNQVLFNMLAPATVEHHITLGASYRPNKNMEWSVNYMHAFENTIKGTTAFSNRPPGEDNAELSMYINSFGVSFGYKM